MGTTWREDQAVLDEELSRLRTAFEAQAGQLNRQRNALAPAYRLPPELLSKVLFQALAHHQKPGPKPVHYPPSRTHYVPNDRADSENDRFGSWQGRTFDLLRFCQVSQYWRSTALGSPELWNHIQIDWDVNPELLDFMKANAQELPLTVDVYVPDKRPLKVTRIISDTLFAGVGRLKSLALYSKHPWLGDQRLFDPFRDLTAPAEQLQSLELIAREDEIIPGENDLFSSGTPNLRYLRIQGFYIPWTSSLLKSPHLTHVVLHSTPDFGSSTLAEMLAFLRHATQLVSLYLYLPAQDNLTWSDVGGEPKAPYELRHMNRLYIVSDKFFPLLAFMKSVEVNDIFSLTVICLQAVDNLPLIHDFTAPDAPLNHLGIRYRGLLGGYIISCEQEYASFEGESPELWAADEPWVSITTGPQFPFPPIESPQFRIPWVLTSLRVLSIGHMGKGVIPERFWEEVATLPALTVVNLKLATVTLIEQFLQAMQVSLKREPPPSTSSNSPTDDTKDPSVTHPFPALRVILFGRLDKMLKDAQGKLVPLAHTERRDMRPLEAYLKLVALKLRPWRDYGHRRLDELRLSGDSGSQDPVRGLEKIAQGLVEVLRPVTARLMIGKRRYILDDPDG